MIIDFENKISLSLWNTVHTFSSSSYREEKKCSRKLSSLSDSQPFLFTPTSPFRIIFYSQSNSDSYSLELVQFCPFYFDICIFLILLSFPLYKYFFHNFIHFSPTCYLHSPQQLIYQVHSYPHTQSYVY